jgi:hypothetical protein
MSIPNDLLKEFEFFIRRYQISTRLIWRCLLMTRV